MPTPIYQVDAFTDQPFAGNPAAVCVLEEQKSDKWMQNVAREMNLSETAFLLKEGEGFRLRWFTPTVEVDLCGHATLASAHVLWEEGYLGPDESAHFKTRSGLLEAGRRNGWIELNFPEKAPRPAELPEVMGQALGVKPQYIGRNEFDFLVEVDSEETLRNMKPDFNLLKDVQVRGIIVTSQSETKDYDFISRFFCPAVGVNEDPVTGSAHCCLAPYWKDKLNKNELTAYQASERGGELKLKVGSERVYLGGQAVTVVEGKLV